MPFALDAIRKLGERGHEVYACDSYKAAPGSHSKYLTGHFTTASATGDTEEFVSGVVTFAGENGIEVVIPMFEEIFYLAAQHERVSKVTRLFAPPFRTLAQVHDKGTFQELCDKLGIRTPQTIVAHTHEELVEAIAKFPQFFGRAAFSRGGVGLLTNTGPLAGHLKPEDCHPTEQNPWLIQEFVDGPMHCTYSCVHGGEVATHMSYRAPRQWEHSTGIQFESVDPSDTLPTVEQLAADLSWDGQMSLDFVDSGDGLMMIECNPRPTDGVLLMSAEELERGLLAPSIETLQVEPGRTEQLDFAVLGQIFQEPLKQAPSSIHDLATVKGTDSGWHDLMPQLYSFLAFAHHERMSLKERKGLFEAMSDGITWDGQAIPGLPPSDAAYLAELTAD
ncbi:MAG: carbamoyl-phosphate synthase large subunit [Solirubrobacterales bacterium]|nr:carbamoyl-phosphate synthase large subunit [Solirubrobacterales bacterium]